MKNIFDTPFRFCAVRLPIYIACLFTASGASLFAQTIDLPTLPEADEPTATFTLDRPIQVRDRNDTPQKISGLDEGRLVIEFPNMPQGAQAIVPVNDPGLYFTVVLPDNYNDLVVAANEGRYGPMLARMERLALPLSRFLIIPPNKTNFHNVVERYYEALVRAGDIEKAVEMTLLMPWDVLGETFVQHAERLVYRTIEENMFELTEKVLAQLFVSLPEDQFAEMAFRTADALRTQEQYDLTSRIYGSLATSSDSVLRIKALLWAGYSGAVAGEPEKAREILNRVEEPGREDENFLTYLLARGRLGYADEDTREGLRYLSRAMVLTSIEATFKPELYYLLIRGYNESGEAEAADRLAREFRIFYPDNPWLKKFESEYSDS